MSKKALFSKVYHQLGDAIANNNMEAMRSLIDTETFLAMLPGIEEPLDFQQFVTELGRQRTMFSDFARNVDIRGMIADDNRLAVWYVMTATNDGPLTNRQGQAVLPPTNKRLSIVSMDALTFDKNGRIMNLVVVSDRMETLGQLA